MSGNNSGIHAVPDATGDPVNRCGVAEDPSLKQDPGPSRQFNLQEAVEAAEANGEPGLIAVMQMAKVVAEMVELVKGYNGRLISVESSFAYTLKGYADTLNGYGERVLALEEALEGLNDPRWQWRH